MTARKLRRDATDAEQLLWRAMREKLPDGKFRCQHPIGNRIADFACPAAKLVIELDGGQHADHAEDDAARTAELVAHGYRVIRFWNNEVLGNLDGVLLKIAGELGESPTSSRHSPPQRAESGKARVTLDDLLARFDREQHHHDLLLDGPPVGREIL
jgi:BirA family biotin operon repressor/biotin-[acetyl-CoA-carboxylase] ligase